MTLDNICTWSNKPDDLILQNMWYIEVTDRANNSESAKFSDGKCLLDVYVQSVNVPFSNVELEKTDFGMINVKERNFPSSVTINFFDSKKTIWLSKFKKWQDTIFDFDKNCVKNGWRKEGKDFHITQIAIQRNNDGFVRNIENRLTSQAILALVGYVDLNNIEVHKIMTHELKNCYISKIDDFDLGVDNGEPMEFSIELECEKSSTTFYNGVNDLITL